MELEYEQNFGMNYKIVVYAKTSIKVFMLFYQN